MIHLADITGRQGEPEPDVFPFTVPTLRTFVRLELTTPVTFFVGENGSGKSTLLEAIACAVGSITVGSASVRADPSLDAVRAYADRLKLGWRLKRCTKGFFMRAEDFFGYVRAMEQTRDEMLRDVAEIDRDYAHRSKAAQALARMSYARELGDMRRRYGDGLDAASHGESFFKLFRSRFIPGGLYLLDEPEAPLSPLRQLTFLSLLKQMVDQDAQFIVATHSPILMAYPDAQILSFDGGMIRPVAYDETEHVSVMRGFLNHPQSYLRHLMADDGDEP
ncbi:MAG: AAA family ATPase [Anaerolineae bacterium]|nr:AAA family ATPase [Anaerolineae bacterium]NUQ05759.1 AAA family ATPase [Anaerolineae bacterium]